ncbi:unnamed protein product [Cylindrotheca closterium]|uniref:Uncharacterized protein n=1 Tax=Cylindrotheca closterium TaxID=2856 RepID=A0AAD2G7U2_9STRA|nr:unnamed protein product [Cylindrotheca closterium]
MSNYVYNPSQKVTAILSKFLEFDPAQLELGIWSGDLSLSNVNLREDAIYPLLNIAANKPHNDPFTKAPLHMKLVSGTVGHMRIRIPWKRLVWGQGDVQMEISDVSIVLAYENREDVKVEKSTGSKRKEANYEPSGASDKPKVSKSYRDAKQRRLNEAERRHMKGMPMSLYLNNVYRKNLIEREVTKAEEAKAKELRKSGNEVGRIESWMKNATSDFFWRFYAGLQGSIKKIRVVVVQDGVEVGCIIQSIEIKAGTDGVKVEVTPEENSTSEQTADYSAEMKPPENFVYESGYDDGEHVDKKIKLEGLGLFVRKAVSMAKVPKTLQFSSSVAADDYILQPGDLGLSYSFFYPLPPERRKKRSAETHSLGTNTTVASTDSTASTKQRRGKRERAPPTLKRTNSLDNLKKESPKREVRRNLSSGSLSPSRQASLRRTASATGSATPTGRRRVLQSRRTKSSDEPNDLGVQSLHVNSRYSQDTSKFAQSNRFSSAKSIRSGVSLGTTGRDVRSVLESPSVIAERPIQPVPKIDCRVVFEDVRVIFSNRHFELLSYFAATVQRAQNGRPKTAIRSVRDLYTTAAMPRDLRVEYEEVDQKKKTSAQSKLSSLLSLSQLTSLRPKGEDKIKEKNAVKVEVSNAPVLSPRSIVTRQWWKYASSAVLWEIREKKHRRRNFLEMYVSFDWERQRYRRQEYINLYISTKLDKGWQSEVWPFEEDREEKLLQIEDELPLEQILLYRSIARSLHVKGISKMPATVLETCTSIPNFRANLANNYEENRKKKGLERGNQDSGGSTLMDLLRNRYEHKQKDRLESLVTRKATTEESYATGGNMSDGARHSSGIYYPGSYAADGNSVGGSRSFGNAFQAGNFYSSGENRRDSRAGPRTITTRGRDSVHPRQTVTGNVAGHVRNGDSRMRLAVSLQVKCIDFMVVEDNFMFEPLDDLGGSGSHFRKGIQLDTAEFLDDESSSDQVSDLSVLTDDQNFFEEGSIGTILQEGDEDDVQARLSSTDFLTFGRPDNVVTRLTVSQLGCSLRGISGAASQFRMYIGEIDIVDGNESVLFSIGSEVSAPVSEVNISSTKPLRKRQKDMLDDYRTPSDAFMSENLLARTRATDRAVSLVVNLDEGLSATSCDIAKVKANIHLSPVERILLFSSKSKVAYPSKLVPVSSRDVARKLMLRKIAASSRFGANISIALRMHGMEVNLPFAAPSEVGSSSSTSSSSRFSASSHRQIQEDKDSRLTFVVDTVELYTGRVVEEMCAQEDHGFAGNSVASGFKNKISTLKNLEMINIVGLTALHDSFECNHWVASISGIDFYLMTGTEVSYNLCEMPIDTEILLTANGMPLLETESPKHKVVVEISPLHVLLSEKRLSLLSSAFSTIGDTNLSNPGVAAARDPDPPRIEILSNRILHSIDLSCEQIKFDLVRDGMQREQLSVKAKELVMEAALSDFLSVGACFDFDLPNEEALSSAMQVCIGRLVGLGFSDDEAWGCTNSARLNFLDDVAQMRQAHDEALVHISTSLRRESGSLAPLTGGTLPVTGGIGLAESENSEIESQKLIAASNDQQSLSSNDITESDDDSAESTGIVEMTISDAVEKTVTMFSPLLEEYQRDEDDSSTVLSIDLPMGIRLSLVKLFYDQHLTFIITSMVVANRAGIEILTLVPCSNEESNSNEIDQDEEEDKNTGDCISFSRFDFDKSYGFGSGGLPISVLGSDKGANGDLFFRERARLDDVEMGELEFLFSSTILEDVYDEISKLGKSKKSSSVNAGRRGKDDSSIAHQDTKFEQSTVVVASCLSILFTNDELVPFCRISIEDITFKNEEALRPLPIHPLPTWVVLSHSFVLQNLSPEGQFYPDVLGSLIHGDGGDIPFQVRYLANSSTQRVGDQLEIEFSAFRLYVLRNFIYEMLHFVGHEKYGLGRLKAKILEDRDEDETNQKRPLSVLVKVNDTSIICPRSSACSDMVAFEVSKGAVELSSVEETFLMPTAVSSFDANPRNGYPTHAQGGNNTSNDFDEPWHHVNEPGDRSHANSIRRTSINLNGVRAFTAIAESNEERERVEDPLFRYVHEVDERAEAGKLVYRRKDSIDGDTFLEAELCEQRWEQISTNPLNVEVLADYAPHLRLLISNRDSPLPFALDARLSQLCLLISIWDSNMQEMPTMFPFTAEEIEAFASPPSIPESFPRYGTDAFIGFLEDHSSVRSEICCLFKRVSIRCTYDSPGRYKLDPTCFLYFKNPGCNIEDREGMILTLDDAAIHIMNDNLNVKRIAVGASSIQLIDERRQKVFRNVMNNHPSGNSKATSPAWADLRWGLRDDIRNFSSDLQVPVMFTVFMTPGWSLINVGLQDINGIMHDLSWLWVLLEYFKSYYTNSVFGNPAFYCLKWAHRLKNSIRKANGKDATTVVDQVGRNIDVRLWLRRPVLCLPSDYRDPQAPSLRLHSRSGLWYRFKSLQGFSSQEVASTDLNLFFVNEFQEPEMYRQKDVRGTMSSQPIVEGLSFGLRYDYNNAGNHTDCSVLIPYAGDGIPSLKITGEELEVPPTILSPPTVCTPYKPIKRSLGPRVCELTAIIEVIPTVSSTLVNFFTGPSKVNLDFVTEEEELGPQTFSVSATIKDVRVFALDPVLGAQLPVAVLSISSVSVTATQFANKPSPDAGDDYGLKDPPPDDLHVVADCSFWADYFKLGLTRSWEPLLEPFQCLVLYERSQERGHGVSIDADSPFHLNLTGAVLQVLGDTVASFSTLIRETFSPKTKQSRESKRVSMSMVHTTKAFAGAMAHDEIIFLAGKKLSVVHETPRPLKGDDRVAFSLCNMSGQRIRIHQQSDTTLENLSDKPAILTYLNQAASVGLTFAATISVIKNLTIQEVAYPGFKNSQSNNQNEGSLNQAIDIQVPGFRWLQGVRVDSFGRKFQALSPRSEKIQLKITRDWRLRNALMILTEVGFDNGGRLVTVRSPFEIRNTTNHPVKLVFHPDPRYQPIERTETLLGSDHDSSEKVKNSFGKETLIGGEDILSLEPGESLPIPTLLLEKSLQLTGSHLGCFWICPETRDANISCWEFVRRNDASAKGNEIHSSFCSRPVQLARIVHESALVFKNGSGQDVIGDDAKTGIQVSCSTRLSSGEVSAPFCYALEVGRSPLVKHEPNLSVEDTLYGRDPTVQGWAGKQANKEMIHSPVAYTLSIHAPIVVVNLLPEGGRFELMHAINRTVLWFADLEPGQQIAVHSVGLDSPLLLLVNLGFCRTPVGEGALVHHGVDSPLGGEKEQGVRFRAIGKAAIQGTKQIGKTLTAMSDSPDKRGRGKLAEIKDAQFSQREKRKRKSKRKSVVKEKDQSLGLDTSIGGMAAAEQGKVHAVESAVYSSNDVATSTTVVDSVGQRLTLSIENARGGGGQRRISLFCPFWIVNNTEHALRYKQDKAKPFVSGTVISPERDGSRPVDGSNRNYQNLHKIQSARRNMSQESIPLPMNTKTIFSGTPGSLATSPGRCDLPPSELAELIEKDIPLQKLADLAFMFNFNEDTSIGNAMLSVQLYDGTSQSNYKSDWSRGVSLDSVGYYQIVGMQCKEGRSLELSVEVNVAPGFLSPYTKIVRFLPRYVVFNRLERPIRLWQDSSVFRPVNEDRGAATETLQSSKLSRKWRYDFEESNLHEKINQYESLFGKPVIIDDRKGNKASAIRGAATITEGTTAHKSAQYIASVGPSELAPFSLPDTRAERQFRVDLGGMWNVTSSFASELPGEHNLKISRATDLSLLKHVSTRAAPKYKIVLPPPDDATVGEWDGELGVFFETDWAGDRTIIVKGTKRGKYAYNHTDIHVGDELLRVDGVSVVRMSFAETMKLIKERLAYVASVRKQQKDAEKQPKRGLRRLSLSGPTRRFSAPFFKQSSYEEGSNAKPAHLTLTFRTFEERLRKLRLKAGTGDGNLNLNLAQRRASGAVHPANIDGVSVEMKSWHNTMFVVIREQDQDNPLFRIQNRSINHIVFYRQRGCNGHPWNHLMPGESKPYSWEEPMKTKKLSVRVAAKAQDIFKLDGMAGSQEASSDVGSDMERDGEPTAGDSDKHGMRGDRLAQALAHQFVDNEERGGYGPSISVRLEEIGYRSLLPIHAKDGSRSRRFLNCEVDTDGGTRLLVVSDDSGMVDERLMLKRHLDTLKKQIVYEQDRISELHSQKFLFSQIAPDFAADGTSNENNGRAASLESNAAKLVDDFPEESTINCRHQIVVEVIEAIGLNVSDFVGSCNPYCEVFLKGRSKSRKYFFQKRKNKRQTYYIQKSLNPRWTDQVFVYDVPQEAVSVTRGYTLQVKLRNFRLVGQHPILGQSSVHFGSLRNQQELVGWYPLSGSRSGQRDGDTMQISDSSRGSIKLRVQWIYTVPALLDYFLLISQRRLNQLMKSREGMTNQLAHAVESERNRREAMDQLSSGRIQNLVKLQRKKTIGRKIATRNEVEREKVAGKLNHGLNSGLSQLKDSLKTSRDKYLHALYFQTVESRRNRLEKKDRVNQQRIQQPKPSKTAVSSSLKKSMQSLEISGGRSISYPSMASPSPEKFQSNRRALNNFFKVTKHRSIRRLSLGIDETTTEESNDANDVENWNTAIQSGKAMHSSRYSQDQGISDIMANSDSDSEEAGKTKWMLEQLLLQGFLFHECGVFFHREHLPRRFRKTLFAQTANATSTGRRFRPKRAIGSGTTIRHFRSWQFVYALYWDPEVQIQCNDNAHILNTTEKLLKQKNAIPAVSKTRLVIMEKLAVPEDAPLATAERARGRADTMYMSRLKFERACKRILGSVLNPGGWLTIRPITVLNLPDTFTGMFVKLRYGSEVLMSETVDARVTPRWSSGDIFDSQQDTAGGFKFSNNDLHVRVEPQQTSGSIMISVVAEKLNSKTELGVLQLPLGDAIAACIDSGEELLESTIVGETAGQPMYIRWFPLMEPRMSEQVEGDMGLSSRPMESEKLRDNMFEQYFTACIQLALIWWPDNNEVKNDNEPRASATFDGSQRQPGHAQLLRPATPVIENYFNADISRISAALIDSQRALELISFAAIDIDVRYSVSKTKTRVGLVVGWFQIDHQDSRAREPVVLAPTPMEDLQPTLQFLALRDNVKTKSNIVSYEYIGVYLQEMDLTVEEYWMFELWEFFMGVLRRSHVKRNTVEGRELADALSKMENCFVNEEEEDAYGPSLLTILQDAESGAASSKKKFYIEQLILGLVKINLSYMKGKKHSWEMADFADQGGLMKTLEVTELPKLAAASRRNKASANTKSEQSDAFQRWSQHTFDEDLFAETGGDASNHLPAIIAAVFPSVSDASIRLQGKAIEHVFESPGEIFSSIKNFYVNETLKQLYKIIGSIDFVGNPTTIISSFVSGVRDLVVVPATAIMRSPTDVNQVGIEVAKGTISFFSHSTSGIFGFLAKMSASAGQTVAILSLDSEYRQWHRDTVVSEATDLNRVWKRRGMQNASKIVLRPVRDIVLGVAMGASGLILSPYKGFKKGGPLGLVRGIATGTAGVVAKPIVGVLDAFTHVSATMHDAARSVNILERRHQPSLKLRLPYTFGPMKILAPFNAVTARATYLLKEFPPKAKRSKFNKGRSVELHIHSEVLQMEQGVDTFAIVSTLRVVLIKLNRENTGLSPSFGWEVSLAEPSLVTSLISDHGHNGVALTITKCREEKELSISEKTRQSGKPSIGGPILKGGSMHSAASLESGGSIDDSDIVGMIREPFSDSVDFDDSEDPNYKYGLTRKQGEILEWFTVLAEFQHRQQLTRLHNAICCVVRDFDAVVIDHASGVDPVSRKEFTFGLYAFGPGSSDSITSSRCNVDTIAALENIPWMQDSTFSLVRNLPEKRQIEEVTKLRQLWTYSRELEASTKQGGARWLIEARARAMFVPTNPPVLLEYLDTYDPVVEKVHWEWKQGNISSEQAARLLESHNESLSIPSEYDEPSDSGMLQHGRTGADSDDGDSMTEVALISRGDSKTELALISRGQHQATSSNVELAERRSSSESFYSAQPIESSAKLGNEEEVVEVLRSTKGAVDFQDEAGSGPNKISEARPKFPQMSKVDRMETLLEQLIMLNVNQATREATPAYSAAAPSPPQEEMRIADSMLNELLALRSEIQVKTKKDEDLRTEISLLRQQLAQADSKTETDGKMKKLQELLGIGARKTEPKKSNGTKRERQEQVKGKQVYASNRALQFSINPQHSTEEIRTKLQAHPRARSFDGSHDSSVVPLNSGEGDFASGASFSSSFRSGDDVLSLSRQGKSLGEFGVVSAQSFDGDGLNDSFLQEQLEDSRDSQTEQEEGKKIAKLKRLLRFGKNN